MPNFDRSKLSDAILQVVKDEGGRPLPQFVLLKKLIANYRDQGFIDSKDVTSVVGELSSQKKLFVLKSGCIVLEQNGGKKNYDKNRDFKNRPKPNIDMTKTLTGTININSAGNGFITLIGEKESKYYVHKSNLNHAQNGDTVVFNPTDFATKGDLIDAVVSSVTEHAKGFYVGEFILEKDGSYSVKPDDEKFTLKITLDDINGLVNGSKILFKINQYESETAHATVSRVIGHKSDVGSDILSIVYDNGVEPDFPDPVIDYAKKLTLDFDEQAKKVRKNLCDKPIITIDPATSKDFDDAFYCEKNPDGTFLLAVQIADVSHYVKYNSILDEEALKRGCSIYLVDRVIPMLPHNLSDDLCSINPNVERFALACDMIIDQKGEFKDIKVYPCIIKSHRRFAYEEVNEYFAKKTDFSKEEQAVKQSVDVGLELSDILTKMKQKRGYVDFEIPEAQIIVDDKCIPTEIKVRTHGRAQKMIEDFMVAANEAVTIYADKKNLPFVYRIHDKPSEDRMKTFALEAKKMNFKISSKMDDIHGTDISRWLEENKDNPNIELARMLLLRSMAKAKYDTKNIGHFGLGSKNYTHFTSPIRRYPDLMVHRIFWQHDFLKDTPDAVKKQFAGQLQSDAELSSKNELTAVKCEREVNKMKFAEYMEKHLGEKFNGFVTSLSNFGIFIQLENLVEGFCAMRSITSDTFQFSATTNEAVGKTGQRIHLGSKVKIEVSNVDKNTRKIEFKILEFLSK